MVDDDAGIGSDGAVLVDDQRVEVEFLQPGSSQTISERLSSTSSSASMLAGGMLRNSPSSLDARVDDQVLGEEVVQRRQRHGAIAEDLDLGTTGAEGDDRPEDRVAQRRRASVRGRLGRAR